MESQRLVHRYNQMQVETSNPLHLIVLAYDGALTSLRKAVEKDRLGKFEEKGREIQRSLDLVNELWSSLDMEGGREIAFSLSAIYRYVTSQILAASSNRNADALETSHDILKELRDAWAQMDAKKSEAGSFVPSEEKLRQKASALAP